MASKSIVPYLDEDPWCISSAFSALMEVVTASLYLLSACISVAASLIIRFFDIRPPCFCVNNRVRSSRKARKQGYAQRSLTNWDANKRAALQNLLLDRRFLSAHSSCEAGILLDCSSRETCDLANGEADADEILDRTLSSGTVIYVDNCQICWMGRPKSSSSFPLIEEIVDNKSPDSQSEAGSDSESSDFSSIQDLRSTPHFYCSCCKKPIKGKQHINMLAKGKSAKVYVEDFEEKWTNLSQETDRQPSDEIEKGEMSGECSSMNYTQEGKVDDFDLKEWGTHSKIYRHSYDRHKEPCTNMLLAEEGEALSCQSPHILDQSCVPAETDPVDDCTIDAAFNNSVDMEATDDLQPNSGAELINELQAALEAEREAYNALYAELEEERSASAIATSETMSMISRLQEEKAAVLMETRQFKREVEEKAAFDQKAIALLKEIICKREEEKFALEKEVEIYRSDIRIKALRRQRRKKAGLQQTDEEQSSDKGSSLLGNRKHKKVIRENGSFQGAFEVNKLSHGSDHYPSEKNDSSDRELSGKNNSAERASKLKWSEKSKNWDTNRSSQGEAALLPSANLRASGLHNRSPMSAGHESQDKDAPSELSPHETISVVTKANHQEKPVEPPETDNEDVAPEESFMAKEEGEPEEQADEVNDLSNDSCVVACVKEPLRMWVVGSEKLVVTRDSLPPGTSILSNTENELQAINSDEGDTILSSHSQKCPEHLVAGGNNVSNGNGSHIRPCNDYSEPLEDFVTIEVDPKTMNTQMKLTSSDSLNCRQPVHPRTRPLPFLYDMLDEEVHHLSSQEESLEEPYSAHSNGICSSVQALARDDGQKMESGSRGIAYGKNLSFSHLQREQSLLHDSQQRASEKRDVSAKIIQSEAFQELDNGFQPETIMEREQDRDSLIRTDNSAGSDEGTSDGDFNQDSQYSEDEYLPGFSRRDVRTISMVKRDNQRQAVEEEVKKLTLRLQVLEDDRNNMKNIMETLRSENGELSLLQDIAQQLHQLQRFEKKLEDFKVVFNHREATTEDAEDMNNVIKKPRQ